MRGLYILPLLSLPLSMIAVPAVAQTRDVTASVTYLQRIALPDDARVVYELRDLTGTLLLSDSFLSGGAQVPLSFVFGAPPDQELVLSAAIFVEGSPAWASEATTIPAGADALTLDPIVLSPFRPMGFATTWVCGKTELFVGYVGDIARMRIGADVHDLAPTVAASGAKFASQSDPETWVWTKGNSLTVSLAGQDPGECHPRIAPQPVVFSAGGNEPGWRLTVTGGEVSIVTQNGDATIVTTLPEPEPTPEGRRYVMTDANAVLTVTEGLCQDTMTGMPHPQGATLKLGEVEMTGCAGQPADLLKGSEWTVEDLSGGGIIDSSHLTLAFEDGRVAGSAGCNRYFAAYELTGEGMTISAAGSTMMACPEALMAQERKFLDALTAVDAFVISDDGALVLMSQGAPAITARR